MPIIPFRVADGKMLAHINRQKNRSAYIRELIKKDMEIEKIEFNIEEVVCRILKEKFEGVRLREQKTEVENKGATKTLIEGILNM